jgi:hypothetical protein
VNAPREAIFWDCRDSETLRLESPEEAIEELFDDLYGGDETLLEQIAKACPLEVKGYSREEVSPNDISRLASAGCESFVENVEEEYGDPDGNVSLFKPEDEDSLRTDLQATFGRALLKATVWRCEVVERKTYSAEEVEAILRDSCPDWFEEKP